MRGPSSTAFSELLEIDGVCKALGLLYRNSNEVNGIIDTGLPTQRPSFTREEVIIAGESFDLYKRDIKECIQALYGSPEHARYMCFTPERHYSDADKTSRLYHDFYTGKWWWATQTALEKENPGATVIPVIISSDKTQVTLFRNKSAYPVYLTIGNLPKEIRRKPSQQGQILLAYLPTTKLQHLTTKAGRRRALANLFHACMGNLVAPLKELGISGVVMQSGDGVKRRCHPILAAYIGDYPEQILVSCGYYGDCPVCMTTKDKLGEYPCSHLFRDPDKAVEAVKLIHTNLWVVHCDEANLKPVQHPFWEDLPYTDIFRSITPDILHQMYQGVMKHLVQWITSIVGAAEIDARVRRLPPNHGIRQFQKGISTLSRVSGSEHKQMCTFLLALIIDIPHLTPQQSHNLSTATRSLLDFLYLACYPIHSDDSLDILEASLATFHEYRDVFAQLSVREHFNLPKLHFLCHYVRAIKLYGTTDNYNTETTERLHIDFTKDAFRSSNRKDEYPQMTRWLERREKIIHHTNHLTWRSTRSPSPAAASLDVGQHFDFPGAIRSLSDLKCTLTQQMAKTPTLRSVSLSKIEDTGSRGYGAVNFIPALKRFIAQFRHPDYEPWRQLEMAEFITFPFRNLPVWHRLKFRNEELYDKCTLDTVCAYPRRYNSRNEVIQHARFDTALIQVNGVEVNSDNYFKVGRVRVIFSLPEGKLHGLLPANMTPPKYLAYVEWFSRFPSRAESYTGLYRLKKQFNRDGTPAASILPMETIKHSVHLYLKWGGTVPAAWTSENVLDKCQTFLLSPFRDTHMYFNMG
ncbi:hypothetical protein GG344DRAFT_59913 [Lentinula edodes]|nr:hypothetical protein GG344DRAFT_59913 [Lentinula edodes]